MNGDKGDMLKEIYESVIRAEEAIKGLRHNLEVQRLNCEKHEGRLTTLEICFGRIKGIFATISTAVIILAGVVTFLLSKFLWK